MSTDSTILIGDAREQLATLPEASVQCCVTSPPYWGLRVYAWGGDGSCKDGKHAWPSPVPYPTMTCGKCGAQTGTLGLEETPDLFIKHLVEVFRAVRRVLRPDGTLWLNLGSSYCGGQQAGLRGTSGKAESDCRDDGCPVIHLCDECRGALFARIGGSDVRPALVSDGDVNVPILVHTESRCLCLGSSGSVDRLPSELSNLSMPDRTQIADRVRGLLGVSLESMTPESWQPPPDGCYHCANCDACLCVLGSSLRESKACARKAKHRGTGGTALPCPSSMLRTRNNSVSLAYSSIVPLAHKAKDLINIPFYVTEALRADGWYLRSAMPWVKLSPMPESCTDRPTSALEYVFLLAPSSRYYFDMEAVRQKGSDATVHRWGSNDVARTGATGLDTPGQSIPTGSERTLGSSSAGRAFRNTDLYYASLKEPHGLICVGDEPVGLDVTSEAFTRWAESTHWERVSSGDVSCGMRHTVLPDCPCHGDSSDSASTVSCDGRAGDSSNRTARTGGHHGQEQTGGRASTGQPHECCPGDESSDSQGQSHSESATRRSTQSRRTGRVPGTSPSCTASAGTAGHTDDKSALPEHSGSADHTPASNNEPGDSADHPSEQTEFRTVDKFSLPIPPKCTCAFYHKVTEKTSHFATFPRRLVEPLIKAGTSERGCCPECGAPWVRVVDKQARTTRPIPKVIRRDLSPGVCGDPGRHVTETRTVGWKPGCECLIWTDFEGAIRADPYDPVPCVVLDPFDGAGTTRLVAKQLGRRGIGIELNPEYARMAEKRIANPEPLPEIADVDGQERFSFQEM